MKNNKTLRQILTGINLGTLTASVVMTIMLVVIPWLVYFIANQSEGMMGYVQTWSLWDINWTAIDAGDASASVLVLNWKVAAAYLIVIGISLITSILKLSMCSVHTMKEVKSPVSVVLDSLAIVCTIIALVSMFIPLTLTVEQYASRDSITSISKITAATQALAFCGSPIALALSAVNGAITLKTSK